MSLGREGFLTALFLICLSFLTSNAQDSSVELGDFEPESVEVHGVRHTGEFLGKSKIFIKNYGVIRTKSGIISPINRKKIPSHIFQDIPGSASHYKFTIAFISDSGSSAQASGEVIVLSQSSEEKTSYLFKELTGVEMSDIGVFRQWRYHSVVITIPMALKHWTLDYESDWQYPPEGHGKLTNGVHDIDIQSITVATPWEGETREFHKIVFTQAGNWLAVKDLSEANFIFRENLEPEIKTVLSVAMASLGY
jgi:hypothetical protein